MKKINKSLMQPNPRLLDIDLYKLEEEWQGQSSLFNEWAQKLEQAKKRTMDSKQQLDYIAAEIRNDIRSSPKTYGLEKTTDKPVEDTLIIQDSYQTALGVYNLCRYKEGVLDAFVKALDHRKRAIEGEAALYAQQYWSLPRGPKIAREQMEEAVRKKIRSKGVRKKVEDD